MNLINIFGKIGGKMEITELTKEDIKTILRTNQYIIKNINFQNNSINGSTIKNKIKYFFKIMSSERCKQEIKGYLSIKEEYPVPKLVEYIEYTDIGILIYEYVDAIKNNQGLLHDFILNCEENYKYNLKVVNNIFQYYGKSLKKICKVNSFPMEEFYKKRMNTRLLKWYKDWEINEYKILINGTIVINLKEIIRTLKNYFEKVKMYDAFLSQGDPNTVNIGIKPIFMDLTTAGYNYIGAEIAAFIWSELIADAYFCPKYHAKSYKDHEKILHIYDNYKPNLKYSINRDKKTIQIDGNIKISKIRKEILNEYLKIFIKNNIVVGEELKYYIVMRILCIFNIREMEEIDTIYSLFCVGMFLKLEGKEKSILSNIELIIENYSEDVKIGNGETV